MSDQVQVSICCLAYNHEKYIRQCLDGFVMQKGVTFEIIIHDDASTDKTADIIREYEKKYPHLFIPIYQTENQYSQHIDFGKKYMVPLITGKYVAMCEGDDYWTDPYKLKKQFDALENNSDCLMCLHKVKEINEDGSDSGYTRPRVDIPTSILPVGYICNYLDTAKYIHTSCFFFVASIYKEFRNDPPRFRQVAPGGDLPLILYFSTFGKAYYINEEMSHYRYLSIGSYSYSNTYGVDKEVRLRRLMKKMKEMFVDYKSFVKQNKCSFSMECIDKEINKYNTNEYYYCIQHREYKSLFKEFSVKELKEFGLGRKAMLKMKLQIWFPKLFK